MKNYIKFLLFISIFLLLSIHINASTYESKIIDNAELFTQEEIEKLYIESNKILEYGNFIIVTTNYDSYNNTEYFATNYYRNLYGNDNGTILVIDMSQKTIAIHSEGNNFSKFTNTLNDNITSNIYKYATKGDYYKCSSIAIEQIIQVLKYKFILEPMKYISNTLFCLFSGFFIAYLHILKKLKRKNNNKIKNENYEINVQLTNINIIKTATKKVRYSQSHDSYNNSSFGNGSSSDHSSSHSSGGFSGGTGSHRF